MSNSISLKLLNKWSDMIDSGLAPNAVLWANEYLEPNNKLRKALIQKATKSKNYIANEILAGKTYSELNILHLNSVRIKPYYFSHQSRILADRKKLRAH